MFDSTREPGRSGSLPRRYPLDGKAASGIGRYRLETVIGSGSMGVVYKAVDRVLGRTVALKTIREELVAPDPAYQSYRERFYREASIFGSLSHPGIVTLYDVGETEGGIPFLTMEYVAGASLAEERRRGRSFTLDRIMWILAQLASAIDYAHRHEVVHRDIKPSNILIGEGDETKITDFGIAKLLGSEFTRSRTRFGTPGYMAPEQVLGRTADASSDMFSLAVVAFELLSGETPFPGEDVHSVLFKLVHAEPVFPSHLERLGLLPSKWREVFTRALSKDPSRRYGVASELVSDLVELRPESWLGDLLSPEARSRTIEFRQPAPQETLTLHPREEPDSAE
jgi:serine/threonine-protein kinase